MVVYRKWMNTRRWWERRTVQWHAQTMVLLQFNGSILSSIDLVECKPRNQDTERIQRRNSHDYLKYDSCVYVCRYVCERERERVCVHAPCDNLETKQETRSVCLCLSLLLLLYSQFTFTNNNWLSWQRHVNQCHHHHW